MFGTFQQFVEYLWFLDFAILCVFIDIAKKNKIYSSSLRTMTVVVLLSGVITQYRHFIFAIKEPEVSQVILNLWLFAFVIVDITFIYLIRRQYQTHIFKFSNLMKGLYIIAAVILIAIVVKLQFGPYIFDIKGATHKTWVRIAHYIGFSIIECCAIYAIHHIHSISKLKYSFIAKMYLLALFIYVNLNVFRFLERTIWDTNYLAAIYRWGLVSINFSTTAVTLLIACLAIYNQNKDNNREGILWNM
jgi:hypothetical protein